MTHFVVWKRIHTGVPSISLIVDRLDETDRNKKIGDPIKIKDGHEKLSLKELAALYPPPPYDPLSETEERKKK